MRFKTSMLRSDLFGVEGTITVSATAGAHNIRDKKIGL